ncbi:MAG: hypothetical protein QXN17_07125, partial [Nitrososphaerota archaeon]
EESAEITLHIKDFTPSIVRHRYLAGTGIDDRNTFDNPDSVAIEEKSYTLSVSQVVGIPPHSINLLILTKP